MHDNSSTIHRVISKLAANDSTTRKRFAKSTGEVRQLLKLQMRQIDLMNTSETKSLIKRFGWKPVVVNGGEMLWKIIQHSDHDIRFQLRGLRALKRYGTGYVEGWQIAFLKDRVLFNRSKPQLYGSQLIKDKDTGKWEVAKLKSPSHVDQMRHDVNLPPLQKYLEDFNRP